MKRQPTPEQKAKAEERRAKLRALYSESEYNQITQEN